VFSGFLVGAMLVGSDAPVHEDHSEDSQGASKVDAGSSDSADAALLTPEILAAQLEHTLSLQEDVQACLAATSSQAGAQHFNEMEDRLTHLMAQLTLRWDDIAQAWDKRGGVVEAEN
jgi:hypothetical protein